MCGTALMRWLLDHYDIVIPMESVYFYCVALNLIICNTFCIGNRIIQVLL